MSSKLVFIQKISEETRINMLNKSAQKLPNNLSSQNWTPQMFKNYMTQPLFDNVKSFYSEINRIVEEINNLLGSIDLGAVNSVNNIAPDDNKNVDTIIYGDKEKVSQEGQYFYQVNEEVDEEVNEVTENENDFISTLEFSLDEAPILFREVPDFKKIQEDIDREERKRKKYGEMVEAQTYGEETETLDDDKGKELQIINYGEITEPDPIGYVTEDLTEDKGNAVENIDYGEVTIDDDL